MDKEVSGYIYFDARLLLTDVNFDKSKVKHGGMYIRFDNLLTHFDFNMDIYSLAKLYAQAQLDIERYVDKITGQTWEICDSLFKVQRFVPTGAEMKTRLQERHSEGLSGIADELIHINTFIDIH